jgi:hypothetical protein
VSAVIVLAGLIVYFRKRHDNKHRPQDNNAAAQN